MTDDQVLFTYRIRQAEETLRDAEQMLQSGITPRSVINRSYYAMFYDQHDGISGRGVHNLRERPLGREAAHPEIDDEG